MIIKIPIAEDEFIFFHTHKLVGSSLSRVDNVQKSVYYERLGENRRGVAPL